MKTNTSRCAYLFEWHANTDDSPCFGEGEKFFIDALGIAAADFEQIDRRSCIVELVIGLDSAAVERPGCVVLCLIVNATLTVIACCQKNENT